MHRYRDLKHPLLFAGFGAFRASISPKEYCCPERYMSCKRQATQRAPTTYQLNCTCQSSSASPLSCHNRSGFSSWNFANAASSSACDC